MKKEAPHVWTYRGHRLVQLEWGLWRDLDRPGYYFLCYRPRGRREAVVRRWAWAGGPALSLDGLRAHVRTVRSQVFARQFGSAVRVTVDQALSEYVAQMQRLGRAPKHLQDVQAALNRFSVFVQVQFLDQISVPVVEHFLQHLAQTGRSGRTQNKYRAHLAAWMTWAQRTGYVTENPLSRVPRATVHLSLARFPMPDDMLAVVRSSPCRYDAALWCLLAFTGLRRSSFLELQPDCFQQDGILVRRTKRGRDWLLRYDDGCPLWGSDLTELGLWVWQYHPPTAPYMRFHFQKAVQRTGKILTLHSLRHGFCSWLVMMGESMTDVAAWAHHSSQVTTERCYAHLRPHGRERIEKNRATVFTMRSQGLDVAFGRGDLA